MRDLNKYAHLYENDHFESVMVSVRRKKVLELANRLKPARVLEVGCGLRPLFTDYQSAKGYVVVEPCEKFYKHAIALSEGNPNIHIISSKFEEAKELDSFGKFDLIVISSLIHELPNAPALLRYARALCHASSVVHVNVPNSDSFHIRLARAMGLVEDSQKLSDRAKEYQRARTYNLSQLKETLESSGFKVVEAGDYFIKPFTHSQMAAMLNAGTLDLSMIDGLMSLSTDLPGWGAEIYVNCSTESPISTVR